MSFKHARFVSKFFSQFVGLLLLLTLSGSRLALTLPPAPSQEEVARLTSEQAIAVALNDLESTENGYRLSHPQHTASFTAQGVTFTPRRGGPAWSWQLAAVSAGDRSLAGARMGAVKPSSTGASAVVYERGALVEQYLAHGSSVEQQFVIPQSLGLGGADLVIEGAVQSAGQFEETEDGWSWRAGTGAVHLGDVRVFDAAGEALPATMQVTADTTRIVVEGSILARATYPVTIDPEIGTNDFRLSDMGRDDFYGSAWAVDGAYNSVNNEYLVVWYSCSSTDPAWCEIYGQRINAATGAEVGANDFRISDMGSDDAAGYKAFYPAVAYNGTDNEYLVVWHGDDDTGGLVVDEYEIFGQRLDGATGAEVGTNDFRLSDMGPDGNLDYDALNPAVVYNNTDHEYLVVWRGEDTTVNKCEIYGQRVNAATGAEVGTNDFRLSDMGPDGDVNYTASAPSVAYNSTNDEYLVVWGGDDNTGALVDEEHEVYGQRVDAATGAEVGANDFRLSDMGPDGNPDYYAYAPDVAYNSTNNEYLVVWAGDDDAGGLANDESEVYGQRVDAATGAEVGTNDFRLSDMGPDGNADYGVYTPVVAYNSTGNEYLVVWWGDDDTAPLVYGEYEVFGQRVDAETGAEIEGDVRLSNMGPDGNTRYSARYPGIAYNSTNNEYLVVWTGDSSIGSLVDDAYEIFGQRVSGINGAKKGANGFRLSDMAGDWDYDARYPAVAYNSTDNEYLVVWQGIDDTPPLVAGEYEIFGQRVDAVTGAEVGTNDFRLSDMGPDGNEYYRARYPAVAYNSTNNEYLVVWEGDDDTPPLVSGEYEIFGQRVDGATGAELGSDFRLSDMGPDGDFDYDASYPDVAYNSTNNEYLVVWEGHDGGPSELDYHEIYGQRVNAATGAELGSDVRLSNMGSEINTDIYQAFAPRIAYNSFNNEYLVVWYGDDDTDALVDGEYEIYGQRVNAATGTEAGADDFRLSDMGPDGEVDYAAKYPAVAYNSTDNAYLVVWEGYDGGPSTLDYHEIYGQRVGAGGAQLDGDVRLSSMGSEVFTDNYRAYNPQVAYNSVNNEYLVAWYGEDDTGDLVDEEYEIYGQQVDGATGSQVGTDDFRLSDMGSDGDTDYNAWSPTVAYASTDNAYLVVWWGDDNTDGLMPSEFEIFGQRFFGATDQIYLPLVVRGN